MRAPLGLVTVLADHGSFAVSLLFLGPVALLLVVLGGLTLRDRRSGRRNSYADRSQPEASRVPER